MSSHAVDSPAELQPAVTDPRGPHEPREPRGPTPLQLAARLILAFAVLGAGIGAFFFLIKSKPEPKKAPRENLGTLVEVVEVNPATRTITVTANGQVIPAQQVALAAEVGGRVVWMNDELVPGGRIAKGATLMRIDARDYSLALEQQVASVDRAATELAVERSRKEIAEREWQLLGGTGDKPTDSLALRQPQMRTAEAAVKAARSSLERAKLSVNKTTVRAPFDAMVHSKSVDMGQLISPQSPVATLVGTDAFWVQVSVPVERLAWIRIPGLAGVGDDDGSLATIRQQAGDETLERQGKVIRLLGDLDPSGRMARVLVEIPDPLGLDVKAGDSAGAGQLPLLISSYVSVDIHGREVNDVFEIRREALRGNDQVFVMAPDSTLDIRSIEVLWRQPSTVLVSSGLAAGDKLVTSPVGAPVQGMTLRLESSDKAASAPAGSPPAAAPDHGGKEGAHAPAGSESPAAVATQSSTPSSTPAGAASSESPSSGQKLANPSR